LPCDDVFVRPLGAAFGHGRDPLPVAEISRSALRFHPYSAPLMVKHGGILYNAIDTKSA
jgi:hypothetical protein